MLAEISPLSGLKNGGHVPTAKRATFLKTGERSNYYGQLRKAYLDLDKAFQNLWVSIQPALKKDNDGV